MRRECRESFPRHRLQRKPLVGDPGMHHGTCVTHVPWSMSGSLTRGGGENVPCIPIACATRNFTYLVRGPCIFIFCCRYETITQDFVTPCAKPCSQCQQCLHVWHKMYHYLRVVLNYVQNKSDETWMITTQKHLQKQRQMNTSWSICCRYNALEIPLIPLCYSYASSFDVQKLLLKGYFKGIR